MVTASRNEQPVGEPHLHIGGLRVWVHGRERENADDFWDGNWLRATAEYRSVASMVSVSGSILRADGIAALARELRALHASLRGEAVLNGIEPHLNVALSDDGRGHNGVVVTMQLEAPLDEHHVFRTTVDPTEVSAAAQACEALLERFPVRGRLEE